ncbi:MAG: glycosyltransferase family 9 protein [Sodalis sp. (in: enterobacteria)]
MVIDFDDVRNYERLRLLHHLAPRYVIGFNKSGSARYAPQLVWLDSERHITEHHRAVLAQFNLPPAPFCYSLGRDPSAADVLAPYLSRPSDEWLIAINPFTGSKNKDFSREQVAGLIAHLRQRNARFRVLLIGRGDLLRRWELANAAFIADSTINTAVEIVRSADLVVSPDTSIVHMACAFNTPLVAIYNMRRLKDSGLLGYNIWAPHYDSAVWLVTDQPRVSDLPLDALCSAVDDKLSDITRQRASVTAVMGN